MSKHISLAEASMLDGTRLTSPEEFLPADALSVLEQACGQGRWDGDYSTVTLTLAVALPAQL